MNKTKSIRLPLLLLACSTLLPGCTLQKQIVLVENGQSRYTVVLSDSASEAERDAAKDFVETLEKISGAKIPTGDAAEYRIFIGRQAPSDRDPLGEGERRIRSEGRDMYIYGEGRDGTVFALYDFLERFLGCRWYSIWDDRGWERIPRQKDIRLDPVDFSRTPSFDSLCLEGAETSIPLEIRQKFARRNRFYIGHLKTPLVGPTLSHTLGQIIPPGKKHKAQDNRQWRPYTFSKDDAYFETHPEYFSLDTTGKRVPDKQLCFSNPGLRRLLTEKHEYIISKEYRGGNAGLWCGLNDNPGFGSKTICCCEKCMELVKKYDSPAGPYWDYIFELCTVLKKRHPQIRIIAPAYLLARKVPHVERLPDNLIISIAPIHKNYLKPYDHPSNKKVHQNLREWGTKTSHIWLQLYPTVYPRCSTAHPLVANIHQVAQNIRVSKQVKVQVLRGQVGYRVYDMTGFNPLRIWLMAQLANDVERDENTLIEEFMADVYGKAAPLMLEYYRELEDFEAKEKIGLTWAGIGFGTFSYLTAENLTRWNRYFDQMETLMAEDPKKLKAIQLARVDLDEAILSVYPHLPEDSGLDFTQTLTRARQTIKAQTEYIQSQQRLNGKRGWNTWTDYAARVPNGVDFFAVCANTPKPLPPPLDQVDPETVLRMVPLPLLFGYTLYKQQLQPDPQAAYGWALPGHKKLKKEYRVFQIVHYKPDGSRDWVQLNDQKTIRLSDVQKHPDEYRLYYIGSSRLFPQSGLHMYSLAPKGYVWLGHLFDAQHPDLFYDFYLSVKVTSEGDLWIDQLVMVERGESDEEQEIIKGKIAG